MRLLLTGASYTSRSIIANAQRCINYYPEINTRNNIVPVTYYQRPGLVPITTVGQGPIRGLYRSSTGVGYVVSGSGWYVLDDSFNSTLLGNIPSTGGPVSMVDNGFQVMLVDGSSQGWLTDLGSTDFSVINDPTGAFTGSNALDFIQTFILWNIPGGQFFGSTISSQIEPFDPTYAAAKSSWPDNLKRVFINRLSILLFGDLKTEIWYNAGLPNFPFTQLPGAYIEHGLAATFSVASQDITTYWLGRNLQGEGMVMMFRGYVTERISNHALEYAIMEMDKTVGIDDAIGMCFQKDGHVFYLLTFPQGDQTWVYDASVGDPMGGWHQEAWTDSNGELHRSRINCHALLNGENVVGDWENSTLYSLDLDTYTDTVAEVASPITCVRTFPHITHGRLAGGNQLVEVDGRRVQFSAFRADFECGLGPVGISGLPAQISLRWSDDRGRTYGNAVLQSNGFPGEYLTQPQWLGMGIARDRLFELSHSIAGPAALNGAWIEAEVLTT
jgi:hypothetical protein